jgi:hypothetical protein
MHDSEVVEDLTTAYQWEVVAERSARQAMERLPVLPLPPMIEKARQMQDYLRPLLDRYGVSLPPDPGITWQDGLVDLSRGHPGVQAMQHAASDEPDLRPAADEVLRASDLYRELSLDALSRLRPMS